METAFLCGTAVPVLVGGTADAHTAGRIARRIFRRHGAVSCWFGRRWSPLLLLYARRYPVAVAPLCDELRVAALLDFAAAPEQADRLLLLIPCSAVAEAFLTANAAALSTAYILLPLCPEDPIAARPSPVGARREAAPASHPEPEVTRS